MELMNSFKKYLLAIVPEIIFKSVTKAESFETTDTRLYGDQYVDARLNTGSFDSIRSGTIPTPILNKVGIYDEEIIEEINIDKNIIPKGLQKTIYELYRKDLIDNYIEGNDYYRVLCGLPRNGDSLIYIDPSDLITFGYTKDSQEDYDNDELDKLTPLHLLPKNVLLSMETNGFLDIIYDQYKSDSAYDVSYIHHLGKKRIDPLVARMAGQYELLYVPVVKNANRFTTDFTNYYEEARQYFLNQIYNYHYNSEYEMYESYIGFFILNMAIQRTINSIFEVVVERDFYDIETCRTFLEAYGVPFIETFSFNQQLILVKKLNILLMEKCTTTVLYDLLDILDFDRYTITKYLLVKQHKMTEINDGIDEHKPIFVYKTTLSDDGTPIYELDKSKMYDYYFIASEIRDEDVTLVEESDPTAYDYKAITEDDAYWIEDNELIEKLQNDEINFVETKYASISVTIRMYEMLFEHIYLQKMICDKGSETSLIFVDLPVISDYQIPLLDLEVLLICLLCKYYNTSPDLISTPSKTLAVLGFNFDADLESIKKDILSHPKLYSKELTNYIVNIRFETVSDVNNMYADAKKLSQLLIAGMEETNSEQVYHAYKKLYQTLFITDIHNEVFTLSDDTIPKTYMEWLYENNYQLYDLIDTIEKKDILDKINYITSKAISWFIDARYLDYLNPMDDTVISGIIRILRWFKSYTIDITSLDVIYLFDSKYYNMMKMLNRIWVHAKGTIREYDTDYNDWINSVSETLRHSETKNKLMGIIKVTAHWTPKEKDNLIKDTIFKIEANGIIRDKMNVTYSDYLISVISNVAIKRDRMRMRDSFRRIELEP